MPRMADPIRHCCLAVGSRRGQREIPEAPLPASDLLSDAALWSVPRGVSSDADTKAFSIRRSPGGES